MSLTMRFRYRFESAHRFTSAASSKCQTPHGHTWYATAIFRMQGPALDRAAMAAEFSEIKSTWKRFITETVDHSFMHHYQDPLAKPMRDAIADARLLPFPTDPTTEMIAGLFAMKLKAMHLETQHAKTIAPVGVLIQETPTNSILFRFEKDGQHPQWLKTALGESKGWWSNSDPSDRSFSVSK